MRTMNIWRKARSGGNHANESASGWTSVIYAIVLVMFAACSLVSCEEKDGDWSPMAWRAEVPVVRTHEGVYEVSADGESFIFSCRNYSNPWFSGADEDGDEIIPPYMDGVDYRRLDGKTFRAEIHDNKLTVDFKANEGARPRHTAITVTAGDIFFTFRFQQSANVQDK